ncbi:MAG: TonB-dependent receptor, partial [Saprospiraceae bacterium]
MYLKKFFTWLLIYSCAQFSMYAQTGMALGKVEGEKLPLEFANVILYSSIDTNKIIGISVSDSTGSFHFNELSYSDYLLKIQLLGYLNKSLKLKITSAHPIVNLNTIALEADATLLSTIEVSAQKQLIKKTTTGLIINARDNLTQIGGTATDLLANTPTVVVDAEGAITVRGKTPHILINGRNSSLGATNRIPASSIETIEIINNPSAQYDADAEGGIINITLKKNKENGTNGTIAAGAGYSTRGRINTAAIFNHQEGKWNLGLAYDNRFADRIRNINALRTNYFLPNQYYLKQNRHDSRYELTQNLKFNIDFSPNGKNQFGLEVIGNLDGQNNGESLVSNFLTQANNFVNKSSRYSCEVEREKVAEFAFIYSRKYNDKRKSLNINLSTSFEDSKQNTDINTQSLNENNAHLGDAVLQKTKDFQNSNISNMAIDYTAPVSANGKLQMGYKAITRYTNADFKSLNFYQSEFVPNPAASNIFKFNEEVHAAYIQFHDKLGDPDSSKWNYDLGLRAEQVYNHGDGITNNLTIKNTYLNLFPTGNLSYYINESDFLKLSFNRRINRPRLGQLNPFIDITDSLNPHGGNPYLKPELINALEWGYNKEWKKSSFSTNLFYRYATNIIRPFISLAPNGVALVVPKNFGNASTYGIESIVSAYPSSYWSYNMSISLFQQKINGSDVSVDAANNLFSWYGKLINNINVWRNGKLQVIGVYNSPVATPQGTRIAVYNIDMGFQQRIWKEKAAIGLVITDIFNTQKAGTTAHTSEFDYYRYSKV